jgi:hypothetical protein
LHLRNSSYFDPFIFIKKIKTHCVLNYNICFYLNLPSFRIVAIINGLLKINHFFR